MQQIGAWHLYSQVKVLRARILKARLLLKAQDTIKFIKKSNYSALPLKL
jgi:hypothetical protein